MAVFHTLDDIEVRGKRVLVRADLNVPVHDGRVVDATRVMRLAPTIRELADRGARVVVISHFGRPKDGVDPSLSLKPLVEPLGQAIGRTVAFASDCVGAAAREAVEKLAPGQVVLLENLRFHRGEEKNDPAFARELAALGDIYVNDAFSTAHRAHASTEAVAYLLPNAAGRLMEAELRALQAALETPERPVAAIVAGSKVSTKLQLLDFLVAKVQVLIIGGAMANTMLFAKGVGVGRSLVERDMAEIGLALLEKAKAVSCELVLPVDAVVATELKVGAATSVVSVDHVPADKMILDVGPATVQAIATHLARCRTLVWNGPVGAFEVKPFDAGTNAIARNVAELTAAGELMSVAGGGDTLAALTQAGVVDRLSYASAAGGAFLEWLEGRELPGVRALKRG